MTTRAYKEVKTVHLPDNGCAEATSFLGNKSQCLECPFQECKHDSPISYTERQRHRGVLLRIRTTTATKNVRNNRVRKAYAEGMSMPDIAAAYDVPYYTVWKILHSRSKYNA